MRSGCRRSGRVVSCGPDFALFFGTNVNAIPPCGHRKNHVVKWLTENRLGIPIKELPIGIPINIRAKVTELLYSGN